MRLKDEKLLNDEILSSKVSKLSKFYGISKKHRAFKLTDKELSVDLVALDGRLARLKAIGRLAKLPE
jgi:hypothetical protein